jgi:hypothetical protein
MGYKQIDRNMTFAEVSLQKSMENNRTISLLLIIPLSQGSGADCPRMR